MLTDQLASAALGVLLHTADAAPGLHVPPRYRIDPNGHLIDVYLDQSPRRLGTDEK